MAINVEKMSAKICESCGESFGCGADSDGCWCAAVELPADTGAELKSKYADCLCPKCLAAAAGSPLRKKGPPLVY